MPAESTKEPGDPIAIVGIGCLFPGCENPAQLWECIQNGECATTDVPEGRWLIEPGRALDQTIALGDHVYSSKGGFIDLPRLETANLNVDDGLLAQLDPLFHLVLYVARSAWRDARLESVDRQRVGVVFGNIVLPTQTASALTREFFGRICEEKLKIPASNSAGQATHPWNAFPAGLPAAFVAKALGLGGAAYTLDAACGSSLYALKLAVDELQSGRADAMICGGVSRPDPLYTQMGFSQLRALSARGIPAPFDADADGLVVGEGAGMFVLKRREDARADGDQIYGVIAGIGLSNDVQGDLLAPSAEGQLRAMRQAYAQAGWSPSDVDLIECHATGTPKGDAVELESLGRLWRADPRSRKSGCVIGSVKSNIGHTLTAAGSAGLIKVLLALRHQMLPPSANFRKPHPSSELAASPFRIIASPEPWPRRAPGQPRRAAVSGFGFGGINAHVLIEESLVLSARETTGIQGAVGSRRVNRHCDDDFAVAIVGMAARFGPIGELSSLAEHVLGEKPSIEPSTPSNWWGASDADWFRRAGWSDAAFPGYYLDSLEVRVDQFRIPPKELAEILPQQSLMLDVAARAVEDAQSKPLPALRTGVLVGIGLDLNTTNYHWRWSVPELARVWSQAVGLDLDADELARWIERLREQGEPALSANRTIGSLGGVVASRVAREFQVGGPSFSISCDELSGIQALAVALDWLKRGELDAAIVGAADFAGDVRAVLARAQLGWGRQAAAAADSRGPNDDEPTPLACDGAVCLVLKRLEDAVRDGDHIKAVIRNAALWRAQPSVSPSTDRTNEPPGMVRGCSGGAAPPIGYLEVVAAAGSAEGRDALRAYIKSGLGNTNSCDGKCAVGSVLGDFGHVGAATGLAAVAKAALCLRHRIIPATHGSSAWLRSFAEDVPALFLPSGRQFWLRNRAQGPRRAMIQVASMGGGLGEVVLEEYEPQQGADRSRLCPYEASQPADSGLFVLAADDRAALSARIAELGRFAREASCQCIDALARRWWQRHQGASSSQLRTAIVADGFDTLDHLLDVAAARHDDYRIDRPGARGSIHAARRNGATAGRDSVGLVYPGLGSHFVGMGREIAALWPDVVGRLDGESRRLRDQFEPAIWWSRSVPAAFADHRIPILASVWVACLVTEILRGFALNPKAAIGYSMGESSALLSLRAWPDRDELCARIQSSTLFQNDLAGPCQAARRHWGLDSTEPVNWIAGIVPSSAESVADVIAPGQRVYLLARNSADECVIGGQRPAVEEVVNRVGSSFLELAHISTVHCEIGRLVEAQYHALHDLETNAPAGIDFYSGTSGRSYAVDRRSAAAAITRLAIDAIDFPAVIERAYQDGVRVFLEVGPGGSCTRLVDRILGTRPHAALSACRPDIEPYHTILEALGTLVAWNVPIDLAGLYGSDRTGHLIDSAGADRGSSQQHRTIHINVRSRTFAAPEPISRASKPQSALLANKTRKSFLLPEKTQHFPRHEYETQQVPPLADDTQQVPALATKEQRGVASGLPTASIEWPGSETVISAMPSALIPHGDSDGLLSDLPTASTWSTQLYEAQRATAEAHRVFLRTTQRSADLMGRVIAIQFDLLRSHDRQAAETAPMLPEGLPIPVAEELVSTVGSTDSTRPGAARFLFGREQCREFAVGSIAAVLGPDFAAIDGFPTRVRLPDEPLLLVDRIISIEGRPRSLEAGRIVTEHVVQRDAWYLDGARAPACIAIEAGQADLFLSAYLGADFVTEGRAVYRLLDATVTFHRGLPRPDEVIRYDIRITHFFRQGDTILFRFQFDATIDDSPLLTMRDGCAGFFSAEELAAGKGVVAQRRELIERSASPAQALPDLVPANPTQLDERQLDALRNGDLFAALGSPFDRMALADPVRVGAGRLGLLHRVSHLDSKGGGHRLGLIRAEADIRPDDWFLVCHFVDDRVMPGTLMYECCLNALKILLVRIGWVGSRDRVTFEPAVGIASRLRCRGQVVESTQVVTYEVVIKELNYEGQPYVIADAIIFADGKPIVEISNLALQLSGTSRRELERLWEIQPAEVAQAAMGSDPPRVDGRELSRPPHVLFDRDRIVEFAVGKPSAAFGDRYRPFDEGRFLARLPAPPFQFIDRVTRIDAEPWIMAAGSAAAAEYDIPADAWYFAASRQESVPHAVLLEAALQACGWLAAYMGSALYSDDDLKFRILGGSATKRRDVTRKSGTLSVQVKATKISKTAGMILQQYEFAIYSRAGIVYDGIADLGFFHPSMLAQPGESNDLAASLARAGEPARGRSWPFPVEAPFPDSNWRMVDELQELRHEGGPHGLGVVRGSARVKPDSWLFQAHFLGDPVWPGSLGQEALLQLLAVAAAARWDVGASSRFESPGLAMAHDFTYRGQITPENREMTIVAEIKECDDSRRCLSADGCLDVDGRVIYQMKGFSVRIHES
jgi:PfaB family protein